MIYQHHKGGKYEFYALAYDEPTLTPLVVYRSVKDGTVWVRTAAEFFGKCESNWIVEDAPTSLTQRFTPLNTKES